MPSGRRLLIRSKIESLILLEWLAYLGEFPALEVWLADAGVTTGADFHTCIARLFLYELEKLTRRHLRKDYTSVFSNEPTIRGRIVTTQLYRKLHRLPHVSQRHRTRTLDTPYNIVLALALDKRPLLLARSTLDEPGEEATTFTGQGGVFYDPAEKLFKMFYVAGWRGPLGRGTLIGMAACS